MTAERGLLYTSRGEVVKDLFDRPVRAAALGPYHPMNDPRRIIDMPKKEPTAFEQTPGAGDQDPPLRVGPPDALVEQDRTEHDIVPDLDTKGFHTGLVPQPAERIGDEQNSRGFRATGERRSKFDNGADLASLKAAHNESENSDPRYAGTAHVPMTSVEEARAQQADADANRPISNGDADEKPVAKRSSDRAKATG